MAPECHRLAKLHFAYSRRNGAPLSNPFATTCPMNSSRIDLRQAQFSVAAHASRQWPADSGLEVAFAGRSNSGKSSALNAIAGRKNLAIASKTPGRTQQIVFFTVASHLRLVDLPGYGYSKVPEKLRMHWGRSIKQYFEARESLAGLIMTMDIRHPLKPLDWQLLELWEDAGIDLHVLLTKCDKLSKSAAASAVADVNRRLSMHERTTAQAFSATSGAGVGQARERVQKWLGGEDRTG